VLLQVWGFFALITSFVWVPFAILAGLVFGSVFFVGAGVAAIRYFSKPPGRAVLTKYWKIIESKSYVKKILYA
jgi:hypothetical protein